MSYNCLLHSKQKNSFLMHTNLNPNYYSFSLYFFLSLISILLNLFDHYIFLKVCFFIIRFLIINNFVTYLFPKICFLKFGIFHSNSPLSFLIANYFPVTASHYVFFLIFLVGPTTYFFLYHHFCNTLNILYIYSLIPLFCTFPSYSFIPV